MMRIRYVVLVLAGWCSLAFPLFAQVGSQTGEEIVAVEQSPDGAALATVNNMGIVRLRDVRTNRIIREMNAHGLEG